MTCMHAFPGVGTAIRMEEFASAGRDVAGVFEVVRERHEVAALGPAPAATTSNLSGKAQKSQGICHKND